MLNYILIERFGIYGAPISTVVCYLLAASLNIFFTVKYVGKLPNIRKVFFMPLLCSLLSIGLSAALFLALDLIIPIKIATVLCILTSVLGYLFLIIKTKTVTKDEILLLPSGDKIVKLLIKLRLMA